MIDPPLYVGLERRDMPGRIQHSAGASAAHTDFSHAPFSLGNWRAPWDLGGKPSETVVCQFGYFSPSCEPSMSCCLSLQSLSVVGLFVLWPGCKSAGKFRSQKDLSGQGLSDQRFCLLSVQERL